MRPAHIPPIVGLVALAVLSAAGRNQPADLLLVLLLVLGLRLAITTMERQGRFARRIVILGAGPIAARLIEEIESLEEARYAVAGVVSQRKPDDAVLAQRWLGGFEDLAEIVERVRCSRIVVALDDRRGHLPLKPLLESRIRGIVVEDALEFYERLTGKMAIEALTPGALILCTGFRNYGPGEFVARMMSVFFATLGLILTAPLLALIALAIKLDSRGPVLFIQERIGRDGRPFRLIKFRTMHPADERQSEWVHDNEERITRVGRWLRRFRLDELPQLVNVLRGEMNLIGPRPHPTVNQQIFVDNIAYYGLRSAILPGVTGWAQIRHGYANNLEEETEKMRYDLYYIKNRTVWLDFRILLETIAIVLFGAGAASVRQARGGAWPAESTRSRGGEYMPWLIGSRPARPTVGRQ